MIQYIKMSSYQYRESHCGDKTVIRSSYLHNGISQDIFILNRGPGPMFAKRYTHAMIKSMVDARTHVYIYLIQNF